MLQLVKLEFRKLKLGGIFRTAALITAGVLGFVLLLAADPEGVADYREALAIIDLLVRAAFIIYASVLLSRLIIEEYRNHTITILFMYPISRKKLLLAKLAIVCVLTFGLIVFSDVLVSAGFYFANEKMHYVSDPLTAEIMQNQAVDLALHAVSSAGMALIPLFFGMLRKSVPATIVSSILVVSLVNASNNGSSLGANMVIHVVLGAIGFLIAYGSIRNVDRADL